MNFINALPGTIAQGLIWGIMSIGLFITYKILDFPDLTVDGSICTGAIVFTVLVVNSGVNIWIALIIAFLAGTLTGLVTAILHTVLGIAPILAGILTQLALWSINLKILGKANVSISARKYTLIISRGDILSTILVLLAFITVIIGLLYYFFGTEVGCSIRATGCNERMSKAQGINTNLSKILALMLSNGIVAISGALLAQFQSNADINMGRGAILIGLASVIIGQVLMLKISDNFALQLFGVAIGGVVYYLVYQLIISLGIDTDLLKLLSAVVVAILLSMPYVKKTYFSRRSKKIVNQTVENKE